MIYDAESLAQWYVDVLGSDGSTQVKAEPVSKTGAVGSFFAKKNYKDMLSWIVEHNQDNCNVYFTLENYIHFDERKPTLRLSKWHPETAGRRCFVVDFDLKDSAFSSVLELAKYVSYMLEFEPHSLVSSGGGVHVYYALNRTVTHEEIGIFWRHIQAVFRNSKAVVDINFKGGHALRSLIRCPQTINWKAAYAPHYNPNKMVYHGNFYDPEDLLPEPAARIKTNKFFGGVPKPDRLIEGLQRSAVVPRPSIEVSMPDVIAGCPAAELYYDLSSKGFKDSTNRVVGDRSDVSMFANLCRHTVSDYGESSDRLKEFITVSETFPDSSQKWLKHNIWDSFMSGATMDKPWQCHKWGSGANPACMTCRHRNAVGFSPWKAGREVFVKNHTKEKEAARLEETFSAPDPTTGGIFVCDTHGVAFSDNPERYFMGPLKIIYKYDDENNERKLLVESNGVRRKIFYKPFSSTSGTSGELFKIGVSVTNAKAAQKYIRTSHDTAVLKEVHSNFGWRSKKKQFVTPFKIIGSGETPDFLWSQEENEERYGIGPQGTSKMWAERMKGWNHDVFMAQQALIMSSFAAPLLELLEGAMTTSGFTINIHSRESGAGKSLALRSAQSIFISPRNWSNRSSDTERSHWDKVRLMKNLPVTWDEITVASPEHVMETVFYVSNGRSRERMEMVDAKKYMTDSFKTYLLVSSNIPMLKLVGKSTQNSNEAAYYRTVDLLANRLKAQDTRKIPVLEIERMLANEEGYGQIGEDFISYCMANRTNLTNYAMDIKIDFDKKYGADRFVTEWASLVITAQKALVDMGLDSFSTEPLRNYVHGIVGSNRSRAADEVAESVASPEQVIQKHSLRILEIPAGPDKKEIERRNVETLELLKHSAINSRLGMSVLYQNIKPTGKIDYYIPRGFLKEGYSNHRDIENVWKATGRNPTRIRLGGLQVSAYKISSAIDYKQAI